METFTSAPSTRSANAGSVSGTRPGCSSSGATTKRSFLVTSRTSGQRGSETSSQISVRLGTATLLSAQELVLGRGARGCGAPGPFKCGSYDGFRVSCTDLDDGDITRVVVTSDCSGFSPSWVLGELAVRDDVAGAPTWTFECDEERRTISSSTPSIVLSRTRTSSGPRIISAVPQSSTGSRGTRPYSIEIVTGNDRGAATDANVFVTLEGEHSVSKSSKPVPLTPPRGGFARSSKVRVAFVHENVGELRSVTLEHDNRGFYSSWQIDCVTVFEDSATRRAWILPCYNTWLDKTLGNGCKVTLKTQPTIWKTYKIHVDSEDETTANPSIVLRSDSGKASHSIALRKTNDVEATCEDIGDVSVVVVSHDNAGKAPDWFVRSIDVSEVGVGGRPRHFACDKWLSVSPAKGGKTSHELRAAKTPGHRPCEYEVAVLCGGSAQVAPFMCELSISLRGTRSTSEMLPLGYNGDGKLFKPGREDKFRVSTESLQRTDSQNTVVVQQRGQERDEDIFPLAKKATEGHTLSLVSRNPAPTNVRVGVELRDSTGTSTQLVLLMEGRAHERDTSAISGTRVVMDGECHDIFSLPQAGFVQALADINNVTLKPLELDINVSWLLLRVVVAQEPAGCSWVLPLHRWLSPKQDASGAGCPNLLVCGTQQDKALWEAEMRIVIERQILEKHRMSMVSSRDGELSSHIEVNLAPLKEAAKTIQDLVYEEKLLREESDRRLLSYVERLAESHTSQSYHLDGRVTESIVSIHAMLQGSIREEEMKREESRKEAKSIADIHSTLVEIATHEKQIKETLAYVKYVQELTQGIIYHKPSGVRVGIRNSVCSSLPMDNIAYEITTQTGWVGWLSRNEMDGKTIVSLPGFPRNQEAAAYTIVVGTGIEQSGTLSSHVSITLCVCDNGLTHYVGPLKLGSGTDGRFKPGCEDAFTLTCMPMQTITSVLAEHDRSGENPNWFLEFVAVVAPGDKTTSVVRLNMTRKGLVFEKDKKDVADISKANARFAVRWTCPEVFTEKKLTKSSTLFSVGMFLLELFSNGQCAYPDMPTPTTKIMFEQRKMPDASTLRIGELNDPMYHLIERCWNGTIDFEGILEGLCDICHKHVFPEIAVESSDRLEAECCKIPLSYFRAREVPAWPEYPIVEYETVGETQCRLLKYGGSVPKFQGTWKENSGPLAEVVMRALDIVEDEKVPEEFIGQDFSNASLKLQEEAHPCPKSKSLIDLSYECSAKKIIAHTVFRRVAELKWQGKRTEKQDDGTFRSFMIQMVWLLFVIVAGIILVNLLIAIMGSTYASTNETAEEQYARNFFKVVSEFETAFKVPPPFNIMWLLWGPLHKFHQMVASRSNRVRDASEEADNLWNVHKDAISKAQIAMRRMLGKDGVAASEASEKK
eukprot:m51a1_g9388 hypothetical protein (1388) ;mRNA; r:234592-242399